MRKLHKTVYEHKYCNLSLLEERLKWEQFREGTSEILINGVNLGCVLSNLGV